MTALASWELWGLLAALAVAVLAAVGGLAGRSAARREASELRDRLATMVDPCEDPVAIRLKCLDRRLAAIAPGRAPRRRR